MPNTVSAKKRVRQSEERALRNKVCRSAMRTAIRQFKEAVAAGDQARAEALLPVVQKRIDKAARQHVVHANTAANRKRKLARLVSRA